MLYPMCDQHLSDTYASVLPAIEGRTASLSWCLVLRGLLPSRDDELVSVPKNTRGMTKMDADRVVDGRNLEPPEPFVQTMEALDAITPGQTVLLQLLREPFPLYRALELNGYEWKTGQTADGTFEILMWHKGSR